MPTALELWFEGSFLCRFMDKDIIRKGSTYYAVNPHSDSVIPLSEDDLTELYQKAF